MFTNTSTAFFSGFMRSVSSSPPSKSSPAASVMPVTGLYSLKVGVLYSTPAEMSKPVNRPLPSTLTLKCCPLFQDAVTVGVRATFPVVNS